jgi:hypothetical protein
MLFTITIFEVVKIGMNISSLDAGISNKLVDVVVVELVGYIVI